MRFHNSHNAIFFAFWCKKKRRATFPGPVPVVVNGVLIHPAFLNRDGLKGQGIEPISGCGLLKAPGAGGRADE